MTAPAGLRAIWALSDRVSVRGRLGTITKLYPAQRCAKVAIDGRPGLDEVVTYEELDFAMASPDHPSNREAP